MQGWATVRRTSGSLSFLKTFANIEAGLIGVFFGLFLGPIPTFFSSFLTGD
jgi:hypothetical protein